MTAVSLWVVLRDVPFAQVGRVIAGANLGLLLALSLPSYLLVVYLRALRWRHLTDPMQPIGTGALFRAVSVGFLANNVFPMRMGEVVRSWYLARETGVSPTAVFGTVILERVIDTVAVLSLLFGSFAIWGAGEDGTLARGAVLLAPVALAPVAGLACLRTWPERMIALTSWPLRPLPERFPLWVEQQLRRFSEGLGALRGGSHLFWIGLHSITIWLVASTVPLLAGFLALDIDLGSPSRMLGGAWLTLGAVGVAVALPSAPGFFGPYHFACKLALQRFDVPAETAVALGTVAHAVFWLSLTALGLVVLRSRRTSLGEIEAAQEEAPAE